MLLNQTQYSFAGLKHRCDLWLKQRQFEQRQFEQRRQQTTPGCGLRSKLIVTSISLGFSLTGAWSVLDRLDTAQLGTTERDETGLVDVNGSDAYLYTSTLSNFPDQSFLRQLTVWQTPLLIVLAMSGTYLLRRQGIYRRMAVVVGFPLFWAGLAGGAFMLNGWLPMATPIGTVIFSALAIQLHEQREKQQLMALLSMNVSPGTAELIWRHKGVILHQGELAAQKLTATVLFMDIRGFTSIAETLPSQQLLPWLNQYFETMTDCIMKHGGMVDKYIGDAIMAVFGAPLPRTDPADIRADAIAALQASLEMHERLRSLNQQLTAQQLPTIEFGIGIHTGPLIGGTVGNRHRLNYSLFGDTVNIAARLETMTKALPAAAPFKLLISADTCGYAQAQFPVKLFRSGPLRGRAGHTEVYTIAQ
jgi:adenylate cyclase